MVCISGNQAGDSKSGVWNPQDFTYLILYGCTLVEAIPEVRTFAISSFERFQDNRNYSLTVRF